MAAGNGEAAVVEEGKVPVAAEVVGKEGEGAMVSQAVVDKALWEAFEKVVSEAVEKKREGAMASEELVGKLVSGAAVEKALWEAFENVAPEVVEKKGEGATVSEVVGKLVSEGVVEKALSEAFDKLASEVVEETVSEALEELVLDSAEKVVSEVAEKESGRMITLKISDGEAVKVKEATARVSKTIGDMIDDGHGDETIPLLDVSYKTLMKVIEYCDEHANKKSDTDEQKEELKNWDKAFIDKLDDDDDSFLFEVLLASSYLKIDGLFDLTYQRVTDNSKAKTTEEIHKAFSTIEIELSDKEEQQQETRPENVCLEVILTSLLTRSVLVV